MATIQPIEDKKLGVTIRAAQPEDAPNTLALYQAVIEEGRFTLLLPDEMSRTVDKEQKAIAAELDAPGCLRLVAEAEGNIVGTARVQAGALSRTAHFGEVDNVWVQHSWRRKGIGKRLMQSMIKWAEGNKQIEKLGLFVFSTSEAAIRLYESLGFVVEGRAPGDIKFGPNDYADTVIMGRWTGSLNNEHQKE
jgi:L-amino acid N-acyltransferase YncA